MSNVKRYGFDLSGYDTTLPRNDEHFTFGERPDGKYVECADYERLRDALEVLAAFPNMEPAVDYLDKTKLYESRECMKDLPPYLLMARVAIVVLSQASAKAEMENS